MGVYVARSVGICGRVHADGCARRCVAHVFGGGRRARVGRAGAMLGYMWPFCGERAKACLAAVSLCFHIKSASEASVSVCAKRRVAAVSLVSWLSPRRRRSRTSELGCGVVTFCGGTVRRLSPALVAPMRVSLRCRCVLAFGRTSSREGVVLAKPSVAAVSLPIWGFVATAAHAAFGAQTDDSLRRRW